MGKAFTEEERGAVREKLRRAGLKLFEEKGIRGVSIRELARAAGIAQGGFYTFYRDKEEFLMDLIELRVREKLENLASNAGDSLPDPEGYLAGVFFEEGMHLRHNKAFDNMISGSLKFFLDGESDARGRVEHLYRSCFRGLFAYWEKNGYAVRADEDGLMNLIRAAGILFSNASLLDEAYFARIYRTFCEEEVKAFLKVGKPDG